jgi:hypothetical protein
MYLLKFSARPATHRCGQVRGLDSSVFSTDAIALAGPA